MLRAKIKIMKYILPIALIIVTLLGCKKVEKEKSSTPNGIASINNFDFKEGDIVLDIRTPGEIDKGALPNATFMDFFDDDFEKKLESLNKSKTYYVYCASGGRSGQAVKLMRDKGFTSVVNLSDGYEAYEK